MEFSLAILGRSKTFIVCMVLFAAANVWSWLSHAVEPICADCDTTIGFPFPFHVAGGAAESEFYMLGLLLDMAIAMTVAITATWLVRMFSR